MAHEGTSSAGWNGPTRLGSYELIRPIAQGGMADIYLARQVGPERPGRIERQVAIKILNEARAADPEARALFLHEARVCALLSHKNIASVLEVDAADGYHYLAMEYVDGVDLRDLLAAAARANRGLPYAISISIVAAAAAGLDHAHRRRDAGGRPLRLVHRDVSLSNIMVGRDGSVKVVDFGIASTTISDVHTMPGIVRGKASYMSPEQCMGDPLDHRTDVFALGVVLYELTTGARCFHGKSDFERMLAVVRGDYIPPSRLVDNYPPELERVIRTALAPAPQHRYESCAAMIEALEAVLAARGWIGGTQMIARLMEELLRAPGAAAAAGDEIPTAGDATAIEPAITARQPVRPETLAASGAIPPHALAIASAPTAPRRPRRQRPRRRRQRPRRRRQGDRPADARAVARRRGRADARPARAQAPRLLAPARRVTNA
jgi:tRNA A-37 threonylcarbamoyl transferase component Bud32